MKKIIDFDNEKTLSIIGTTTTVVGLGLSLLGTFVTKKQSDKKIEKAVKEYLEKKDN